MFTQIDYTIKIPMRQDGERIGCSHCANSSACQFYVQIFTEHHRGWKTTIGGRTQNDFIGLLCKNFNPNPK